MVDYIVISSREQAIKAWDREQVIIREDEGYYFIYPLLGKGYKYPSFDLRRDCCLNTFVNYEMAAKWSKEAGYQHTFLR